MTNQEQAIILAEKVKLLFGFCIDLRADKEMLKEVLQVCEDRQSFSASAAPLLGAFGVDYEEKELEVRIRAERADALIKLIETLERTEEERIEFLNKQEKIKEGRKQLLKILGN